MPRLITSGFLKYNIKKKFLLSLLVLISLLCISLFFHHKYSFAQSQATPNLYVPCNQTRPTEFHSLRPYQASPCNQNMEDLALFCGNDFILSDPINIVKTYSSLDNPPFGSYPISWSYTLDGKIISPMFELPPEAALACRICDQNRDCVPTGITPCAPDLGCQSKDECLNATCEVDTENGTESCTFIVDRTNRIAVDLSGADLPIMGYTEPSVGNESDPYKPFRVINSNNQNENLPDADKVNEYVSWYLNGTIGRAEYPPPERNLLGELTKEGQKKVINYSGPLKKLLSFESQIVERIKQVRDARTSTSSNCDPNLKNPSDPDCIRHNQIIGCHILGIPFACYPRGALPTRLTNWIRNLLPYIPFSSTEDRLGNVEFSSYSVQPASSSNIVILRSAITEQSPAELFFSHMEESVDLADLTQKIFSPQDANLDASALNTVTANAPFCNVTTYRRNPGDDLFATEITATVEYTAQITCTFTSPGIDPVDNQGRLCKAIGGLCYSGSPDNYDCDTYFNQVDCLYTSFCGINCSEYNNLPVNQPCNSISGYSCYPSNWNGCTTIPDPTGWLCPSSYICGSDCSPPPVTISNFNLTEQCNNNVLVSFHTITNTPLANQVWAKLVSGPAGVFRRIFPQISDEEGRPIRRLWDIPAATNVTYTVTSGNASVVGGPNKQLYFPHIGGVHEYFLNCIQKTLRPQGYGRGCVNAPENLNPTSDSCPSVPNSQVPSRYQGEMKFNFIRLANIWTADCPGPENNLAEECYNYVVSEADNAGVNPAFALTIWLNESGASNYCHGGPTTQDFGIRLPNIFQNLVGQLEHFLFMSTQQYCLGIPGFIENMHRWLGWFRSGNCNPEGDSRTYYESVKNFTWQVVTEPLRNCVVRSRFGINWPTDGSCP